MIPETPTWNLPPKGWSPAGRKPQTFILKLLPFTFYLFPFTPVFSQPARLIDKVVAVVGDHIVLSSDIEIQLLQLKASGSDKTNADRCQLIEDLLYQKLLLHQAQLDSVEVSEAQIQSELERRLRFFINQIGSEQKLEEYYQKSLSEIKSDFHDLIKEQLLVQTMQQKVTGSVKISPVEVKVFFDRIPKDSLPLIPSQIEVAHIVKKPVLSAEDKKALRDKLEAIRNRILKGEDFGTLAYLYSEDPGSAKQNGELGFVARNTLVPEFAAVAFNIKPGEVSEIVETEYGLHIIQFIERRGEQVNVRHILVTPKPTMDDLLVAKSQLDSISNLLVNSDTLTFEQVAFLNSDDKDSKMNGGKIANPQNGTTRFDADVLGQLDGTLFFTIDRLNPGEISEPILMQKPDGSKSYRLIKLLSRSSPHRANMKEDYQKIQDIALIDKQNRLVKEWVDKRIQKTYIHVENDYKKCNFGNQWLK